MQPCAADPDDLQRQRETREASPQQTGEASDCCRRSDLEQLASADLQIIGNARCEGLAGDGPIGTAMRNIEFCASELKYETATSALQQNALIPG